MSERHVHVSRSRVSAAAHLAAPRSGRPSLHNISRGIAQLPHHASDHVHEPHTRRSDEWRACACDADSDTPGSSTLKDPWPRKKPTSHSAAASHAHTTTGRGVTSRPGRGPRVRRQARASDVAVREEGGGWRRRRSGDRAVSRPCGAPPAVAARRWCRSCGRSAAGRALASRSLRAAACPTLREAA